MGTLIKLIWAQFDNVNMGHFDNVDMGHFDNVNMDTLIMLIWTR